MPLLKQKDLSIALGIDFVEIQSFETETPSKNRGGDPVWDTIPLAPVKGVRELAGISELLALNDLGTP